MQILGTVWTSVFLLFRYKLDNHLFTVIHFFLVDNYSLILQVLKVSWNLCWWEENRRWQLDVVTIMWHLQYSYILPCGMERLCVVETSDINIKYQMACGQCGTPDYKVVWYGKAVHGWGVLCCKTWDSVIAFGMKGHCVCEASDNHQRFPSLPPILSSPSSPYLTITIQRRQKCSLFPVRPMG